MNIFWGIKILWIFFLVLGVISKHFRSLSKGQVQNGLKWGRERVLTFQIFFLPYA